jgi:hypothetical protein
MRKQRVATSRFLRHVKPFLHFFENFFGAGMPAAAAGNRECLNFSQHDGVGDCGAKTLVHQWTFGTISRSLSQVASTITIDTLSG